MFYSSPSGAVRQTARLLTAFFLLSWTALLSSCSDSEDKQTVTPDPTIKLATTADLGSFLTDKAGNTLYYFTRDVDGKNVCTGGCAAVWPIFYEADIQVGGDLKASDFTTQMTTDGQPQTVYKGWPLYYYAPLVNGQNVREATGQTTGNGVGSVWYVVNPSYSIMVATKSIADKSTNQSANRNFLIDSKGRTLYTFLKDDKNPGTLPTNCIGNCATVWPSFYTAGRTLPSALKASDFSTITRTTPTSGPYGDGTATNQQLTYKGKPLYYYTADNQTRGQVEGNGLVSEGDKWQVATP
jgi:predicted lipoprotein with Yx(FWY)xxD motif